MRKAILTKALLALTGAVPLVCLAESTFTTGAGSPLTATAHVDFQITIPRFIFLRVGTGTGTAASGWATGGSVDPIAFAPTAAQVGSGALAATALSGDLGNGTETAVVVANNGNVTFSSQTLGALSDGAGDNISYTQITTTPAHNTTGTTLLAPALADAATTTITLTAVGKVVQQDAKWTYTYVNTLVPAQGTYGGVNSNNSRVTYTVSVP
jgi:hypothetical protein